MSAMTRGAVMGRAAVFLTLLLLAASAPRALYAQQVPHPVGGPATSTMDELASWNSLYGNAIKQGPAFITNDTPSISIDGSPLTARNTTAFTASQILDAAVLVPPGTGAKNYDALRGITFAPAATTINLVSGVSAYLVSDAATVGVGGFPAAVGLFAAGVARGNGAKIWGVNTLLSDTMTGAVSAGTGKALNNEFDFNVSSPNTTILALQLAGSSIAQPSAAYGVVLQPLDSGYPTAGTIKWSAFLQANPGATNIFAGIGPKQVTGASIASQDIIMGFYDTGSAYGNIVLNGSSAGGLQVFSANSLARAVTITGGAGRFAVEDGGGFTINSRIVMQGTGANFGVGANTGYTTQTYGNATATTAILGSIISLNTLPTVAGGGGLTVCIDASGVLYKKAACP
jgi:hypothetical protein